MVKMISSTASSRSLEEVAQVMGSSPRWFQLYWPKNRELATSFLHRAEQAGYRAIVVTLDTWLLRLALEGEAGVRAVLRALLAELDLTMALSGVSRIDQLSADLLQRRRD